MRGVGSGLARSSRSSAHTRYLQEADDGICLLVQVETSAALAQLDAIAAVDGVHGVFIGSADLSASMGHLGNPGHPEVRHAIDSGIARFVAVGVEATMLARVTRELAARFKPKAGDVADAAGGGAASY